VAPEVHVTHSLPVFSDEQQAQAMRFRYLDTCARLALTNRYLRLAVLALAVTCIGLTIFSVRALHAVQHVRPVIVRIDDVGRAEAIRHGALSYIPREPEMRYFLRQFVALHFARMRATLRQDFGNSLLFLDGTLSNEVVRLQRQTKSIENFLASADPDIDISVANVTLQEIRTPPYKASVDYERVYYQPHTRQEIRRERYVGTFHFVVAESVPNELVPINPLGLLITYYREDQAFVSGQPGALLPASTP
jgi:type IV secretory pathway component VirB8